mgnify:CR=1 FL=1
MRLKYKFCDCGFCPAIFDTRDEAVDFKHEHINNDTIGIDWTYKIRKIKAGWVVYI